MTFILIRIKIQQRKKIKKLQEDIKMAKKKIAILDSDGTLNQHYVSMDFIAYLNKENPYLYNDKAIKKQEALLKKFTTGKINYSKWIKDCLEAWADAVQYNTKDKMEAMAKEFFTKFKKNIFPSSYELVKLLKEKGYYVILLSVGVHEAISLIGKELEVDEIIASQCKINKRSFAGGTYTGELNTNLHKSDGKKTVTTEILSREEFSKIDSLAAGDSESDAEVLEMVQIPLALNPHPKLRILAKEKHWHIANYKTIISLLEKLL